MKAIFVRAGLILESEPVEDGWIAVACIAGIGVVSFAFLVVASVG